MSGILIVDDHPIVLQGCRRVLEDMDFNEIYEVRESAAACRSFESHDPDLVILDLAMDGKGLAGLKLIERMLSHKRSARILVFTMHRDPIIVVSALKAGALGYTLKDSSSSDLNDAILKVMAGKHYLSHELALQVALMEAPGNKTPLDDLSTRELEVLTQLAKGQSYNAIAERLHVSYKTVANCAGQLKQKFTVSSLPELVSVAVKHLGSRL
jgi:DNA-binding NarL/FixJ family response regulator